MVKDLRAARQRVKSFLLRHGRVFKGTSWKDSHRIWLGNQTFEHPAQQIAFQNDLNAIDQAEARRDEVDVRIRQFAAEWSMAPVVATPARRWSHSTAIHYLGTLCIRGTVAGTARLLWPSIGTCEPRRDLTIRRAAIHGKARQTSRSLDNAVPRAMGLRARRPITLSCSRGARPKPGRIERMFSMLSASPSAMSRTA